MTMTVQQYAQKGIKHPGFRVERMVKSPYRTTTNLMLSPEAVAEDIRIGEEFLHATPQERKEIAARYRMNATDATDLAQIAGIFGSKSGLDPFLVCRVGIKGLNILSKGVIADDLRQKVIALLMHWLECFWYENKKPCVNGLPPFFLTLSVAINGLNNLTIDIMHAKMLKEKGIATDARLVAMPTPRLVMVAHNEKDIRDAQRYDIEVVPPTYVPPTLPLESEDEEVVPATYVPPTLPVESEGNKDDDATTIELEAAHHVAPVPPALSGFASAIADHSWATLGQENHSTPVASSVEQALNKLEERAEYLLTNQAVTFQNIIDRVTREIVERRIQAMEHQIAALHEMFTRKGLAVLREATHSDQALIRELQEKNEQQAKALLEIQEETLRLLIALEEKDKRLQEVKEIAHLLLEPEK